MHFIVYTKDNCPFCVSAKNMISRNGGTYEEINVSGPEAREDFVTKYPWARTLPQIFKETEDMDNHIGGFDKLTEFYKNVEVDIF